MMLDLTEETEPICGRGPDGCEGEVFARTSRSSLTRAWICERHERELNAALDAIAERYPEVNHPEGCGCYGCSEGVWVMCLHLRKISIDHEMWRCERCNATFLLFKRGVLVTWKEAT